jgi:hypothetical protein
LYISTISLKACSSPSRQLEISCFSFILVF